MEEEVEVQPGSGGTRLILTACHWLTSRGGEAPRNFFVLFFTSELQRSYLRFLELVDFLLR